MIKRGAFACLLVTLSLNAQQPDDCSLTFNGSTRKQVKLRSPSLASSYPKLGSHTHPKGVAWWLATVCNWETHLPATIPGNTAMPGLEDRVVTLQGYVLAVRFESGTADHDLHIEMSGTTGWSTSAHVIVEIPPGQNYCTARQALWQLAKDDASPSQPGNTHYFAHPKKIQVVGFVFYDKAPAHTDNGDCTANGGRGLHKNGTPSMVHSLWELHPVIKIQDAVAVP